MRGDPCAGFATVLARTPEMHADDDDDEGKDEELRVEVGEGDTFPYLFLLSRSQTEKSFRLALLTLYHFVYGRYGICAPAPAVGEAATDSELAALLYSDEAGEGSGAPAKSAKSGHGSN